MDFLGKPWWAGVAGIVAVFALYPVFQTWRNRILDNLRQDLNIAVKRRELTAALQAPSVLDRYRAMIGGLNAGLDRFLASVYL